MHACACVHDMSFYVRVYAVHAHTPPRPWKCRRSMQAPTHITSVRECRRNMQRAFRSDGEAALPRARRGASEGSNVLLWYVSGAPLAVPRRRLTSLCEWANVDLWCARVPLRHPPSALLRSWLLYLRSLLAPTRPLVRGTSLARTDCTQHRCWVRPAPCVFHSHELCWN